MNDANAEKPRLLGISGEYRDMEFPIGNDPFVIGRHFECDLTLKEMTVSSRHARLVRNGDFFELEDLDSTNGTFVNGLRVKRTRLRTGDRIGIEKIEFTFLHPREVERTVIANRNEFLKVQPTVILHPTPAARSDSPAAPPPGGKSVEAPAGKASGRGSWLGGILLALMMSYLFGIGFAFLLHLVENGVPVIATAWTSLKLQLAAFPVFHTHLPWLAPGLDAWKIMAGICVPLGLMFAGIVIQRFRGGSRLANAAVFSVAHTLVAFFLQLAVMNFDFSGWFLGSGKLLFSTSAPALGWAAMVAYVWLAALALSCIGTLFSRK